MVLSGGPELGVGSLRERLDIFRERFDHYRSAIVNEPRGCDAIVGALLCKPIDPSATTGAIFFNNVGFLGMCGHGTIGLIVTLAHLGKIGTGLHRIETPVGVVEASLHDDGRVTVRNVASYRSQTNRLVEVPGFGQVTGDIAWGGNWFFLSPDHRFPLTLANVDALTEYAWKIRGALRAQGITGTNGDEIDHIELLGAPTIPQADSRNFVLCPGKSYDRSPCGTGTSAKLACLYASGQFTEGQIWRQQSITDSVFEGSISVRNGVVHPHITGSAFVNAESFLILDERDPLRWGIGSGLSSQTVEALTG